MDSVPNGIILTTCPTGSGKTTTLYTLLKAINDEKINITTIEDPIEIRIDGINQSQINTKAGITFASCMRAILRQDPDVILVGEIRDEVTAEIALEAAETGHLVLSTLHTIGSVETVDRLISLFPPEKADMARMQIADTLKAVVSQQLLPKVGGGRIAVFETFFTDYDSCNLIRDKQHAKLREFMQSQKGRELGCSLMDANLLSLLQQNKITKESAVSYAINRYDMRKTLERLKL
jgi:Tfp pilus assembly pilus retraction ATPase PilT